MPLEENMLTRLEGLCSFAARDRTSLESNATVRHNCENLIKLLLEEQETIWQISARVR